MKKTFKELCELFEEIENTSSRLDMTSLMSVFLKQCSLYDIQVISYLVQGRVAPMFVDREFGYSEKSFINLVDGYFKSKGKSIDFAKMRKKVGDIGDCIAVVSKDLRKKTGERNISEVYVLLWEIVNTSGLGSVERKGNMVMDFLRTSSDIEAKYFARIVCGSLRLGMHSKTMMDVFSYIVTGNKDLSEEFNRVYGVSSDIGYVASLLNSFKRDQVEKNIKDISVTPGFPILARLVERVGSFEEVFERLGDEVLVQPKFDGLRLQIHRFEKEDIFKREVIWQKFLVEESAGLDLFDSTREEEDTIVKLFTRNLEDVTDMFPEVVEEAKRIKGTKSFILDSEVLGWNYSEDTFLSYQETMQRKRKYDVDITKESIPVKSLVFDLLYLNGKDLTGMDTEKRIEKMKKIFGSREGSIEVAETLKVGTIEELKSVFDNYVNNMGLEGVIVKQVGGGYRAGTRNYEWIKLKKSMENGLVDTVDFVVVGYYMGSGRRAQLGIGALLGAIYNEESNTYDAICKVGTGISDELFKKIVVDVKSLVVSDAPKRVVVNNLLKPDVWVIPKIVITVDADEVTRDISKDKNGIGNGLSLRFPRLIEWDRDTNLEDVTTVKDLTTIFESKSGKK
ncbi:ATP-dependent DNA ligase [bacterium]|nr:ATP-dependent DNA ligase [bacterium]